MHSVRGRLPAIVEGLQRVESYAEIEEVMKHPDFAMAGAPERWIFLEDTLIMSEGERHAELKRLFAPLMSRQAIAYYELHLFDPVIQALLSEAGFAVDSDGYARLDVVPLIHAALTRISATATGVDRVDTPERTAAFLSHVLTLSAATSGSFSGADPVPVIQAGRDAMAALADEFLAPSLDRRIALAADHAAGRIAREDLPRDVLMSMALEGDLSHPDDDEKIPYIWRTCALFLTASIKTTSHALPHLFVHLDAWLRDRPEDRARLTDPDFLHRAFAETVRLHQSAPVRFRAATRDVTLSTGRHVAKGEMVALIATAGNADRDVFGADAEQFNPHRVPHGNVPAWGMGFGLGRHRCLGQNLVTGIQNRGDDKLGTDGTAVRIARTLYRLGAELDPDRAPRRNEASLHGNWDSVPIRLRPRELA